MLSNSLHCSVDYRELKSRPSLSITTTCETTAIQGPAPILFHSLITLVFPCPETPISVPAKSSSNTDLTLHSASICFSPGCPCPQDRLQKDLKSRAPGAAYTANGKRRDFPSEVIDFVHLGKGFGWCSFPAKHSYRADVDLLVIGKLSLNESATVRLWFFNHLASWITSETL